MPSPSLHAHVIIRHYFPLQSVREDLCHATNNNKDAQTKLLCLGGGCRELGSRLPSSFCSMRAVGGGFFLHLFSFFPLLFKLKHSLFNCLPKTCTSRQLHTSQHSIVKQARMAEQIPKYDCNTAPFAHVWRTRSNGVHRLHRKRRKKK